MLDLSLCPLSAWTGKPKHCHWCDKVLTGRQQSWCSKSCYLTFNQNHRYTSARQRARVSARGYCPCPTDTRSRLRHPICRGCGRCEAVAGKLECNHKVPRNGDRSAYSCLHHQHNLEMLCHECHGEETAAQWADGRITRSSGKPKDPVVKQTVRKPRKAYTKDKLPKRHRAA